MHWVQDIVTRTTCVYFFLLVGLRVAGKRELGQMTIFDLVVVLVISNAVQNAMVGDNTTLQGGLLAAGTLLGLNFVVAVLRVRFPALQDLLIGTPTTIVRDGHFLDRSIEHEELDRDQVLQALREHGVADVKDVKLAVLETDGTISVVPQAGKHVKHKRKVRFLKHH